MLILMYGEEIWTQTKTDGRTNGLEAAEMTFLRSIEGKPKKEEYKKTKILGII
jgi:hypothetical protein